MEVNRSYLLVMKLALCGLLFCTNIAQAGLEKYSALLTSDAEAHASPTHGGIRITYLGVNGYQFETDGRTLLIDPYFSRVGFLSVALNQPIASNRERVDEGCQHLSPRADAVLVTHAHFDHLLDVPDLMQRTGARLLAGPTAVHLVEALGVPGKQCDVVRAGAERQIGPWTIRVYAAQHDRLFGSTPFPGQIDTAVHAPTKSSDWKLGEPLAFVVEAAGKRIYVDAGGVPGSPPRLKNKKVDLAILGVALPDSRERFAETVRSLRPRYILPSHQDDFFVPLDRGFVFGNLTNFPALLREHETEHLPGRVILLDYFRPWTLR